MPSPQPSSRDFWFVLLAALAGSTLLYVGVLGFEFLSYDDYFYVRDNPHLNGGFSWDAVKWAWEANLTSLERKAEYWMPLTLLSRLIDSEFFPGDGGMHHLQGILLHGLNVALLFQLLSVATGQRGRSAAVALLFLVHPLGTEVVGWVALRKDVLAATLSLGTLLLYVRFTQQRSLTRYLLALACFLGAMAAKPSVISLPLALVLFDLWPLRRLEARTSSDPSLLVIGAEKLPFLLLAAGIAGLTYVGQNDVGSAGGQYDYTLCQRVEATLVGMVDYLQRVVLPHNLCVLYPQRDPALLGKSQVIWSAAVLMAMTGACLALAFTRRGYALIGWAWFLGLLVPVSGLVQFGRQATADRYVYLPMIGLLVAFVWLCSDLWDETSRRRWQVVPRWVRVAPAILLGLLAGGLGWAAHQQARTWRNNETLWEHAMTVEYDHAFAFQVLGSDYFARTMPLAGENLLRAALKMMKEKGEVQAKLGLSLVQFEKYESAVRYLDEAIRSAPRDLQLHRALVASLRQLGREGDAQKAMTRMQLVRLEAFISTGLNLVRAGELTLAREQFNLAWSAFADAKREAGGRNLFRRESGFWKRAAADLSQFGTSSFDVGYLRACVEFFEGNPGAAQEFGKLANRFPDEAEAWWRLAICRAELGEAEAAKAAAVRARAAPRKSSDGEAAWLRSLEARPQTSAPRSS